MTAGKPMGLPPNRDGDPPRVSVLIPVHNQARFLPHALASVARQGFASLELIVADDGSTDDPEQATLPYAACRFFRRARQGITETLNFALSQARGDYVTFLDADDWWSEDKLVKQVGLLDALPHVDIAVGSVLPVRCAGDDPVNAMLEPVSIPFPLLNLGSVVMRRSAFDRVGPLDPHLLMAADWDWFLRAHDLDVPMRVHEDVVLYYRRHAANTTRDTAVLNRELLKLFKKTLDRRRGMGAHPAGHLDPARFMATLRQGSRGGA